MRALLRLGTHAVLSICSKFSDRTSKRLSCSFQLQGNAKQDCMQSAVARAVPAALQRARRSLSPFAPPFLSCPGSHHPPYSPTIHRIHLPSCSVKLGMCAVGDEGCLVGGGMAHTPYHGSASAHACWKGNVVAAREIGSVHLSDCRTL